MFWALKTKLCSRCSTKTKVKTSAWEASISVYAFSYVTWLCEGCKLSKSKSPVPNASTSLTSGSYRSNLWRRITRNRSISSTYFVRQLLLRSVEILIKSAVQQERLTKVYKATNRRYLGFSPLRGVSPTKGKKFYVSTCPLEWQEWASINLRANAQKNRANRGHSLKPNPPSFSVYNKVLRRL